ncbi:MAG: mandelate racemase/muconate lactonizing enzyme family protein [Sandaracinaceae bacterium]
MEVELQTLYATIEETGNAKRSWTTRNSVRLYVNDGDGHIGLGEAAPLPGWSPESSREAEDAIACFPWPDEPPLEVEEIDALVSRIPETIPSARYAVESALTSLAASILSVPLWAMWAEEVEPHPLSPVLFGSDDFAVKRAAREALAHEVNAVKMKVGVRPETVEDALLREVRGIVGPMELRLDANRSIAPDALEETLERLAAHDPVFLEEPCALEHVLALEHTPFPLAIDESLLDDPEGTLDRALECDHIGAVILKPSLLGGVRRCRALAETARKAGRAVVVSHLMEGIIGRCTAAHLALAIGGSAAGLGEHPALGALSDGLTATWIDLAWIAPPALPGLGLELAW